LKASYNEIKNRETKNSAEHFLRVAYGFLGMMIENKYKKSMIHFSAEQARELDLCFVTMRAMVIQFPQLKRSKKTIKEFIEETEMAA